MKKIFSLMLVLVMLSTLVGCNFNIAQLNTESPSDTSITPTESTEKTDAEKAIIGAWVSRDSVSLLTFNEDNTGILKQGDKNRELRWKYDEEYKCYLFTVIGTTQLSFILENKDGEDYINVSGVGETFYRQDNVQ